MRVAIDATYQRHPDGGIARSARELTAALRARDDIEIIELGGGRRETRGTFRQRAVTLQHELVWHPWLWRCTVASSVNLYHAPGLRGPLSRGRVPVVVTVHDVGLYRHPELTSPWKRAYRRATQKRAAQIADRVICNSNDTANDVVSLLKVSSERVRVTAFGVDRRFFDPVSNIEPPAVPYVLFVGSEQPRKNLERLEHAVGILRQRGYPHMLVTAGADAWGHVKIGAPYLRRLGTVTDDELRVLYAQAACLAIPSLHEGFGLPALEAMATGTPVVAARVGALPEVTGSAAILVNPLNARDIARGLEVAINDGGHLRELGRRRAADFTWERTADATVEVYRELL